LISEIAVFLTSRVPAVRGEAANALAQAVHVEKPEPADVQGVQRLLREAVKLERDETVRGTLARSLGRLPYISPPQQVKDAETAIMAVLKPGDREPPEPTIRDAPRAQSLIRHHRTRQPPSDDVVRALKGS
jgi:hypothetical protein